MLNYHNRDELRERLEILSQEIITAKDRFHQRGHKSDGVHMSNLINIEQHQKVLDEQLSSGDEGLWQNMKQSWHEDLQAMLESFSKIIEYEDSEFRKNQG